MLGVRERADCPGELPQRTFNAADRSPLPQMLQILIGERTLAMLADGAT
jgi:hypothetical protein